MSFARVIAPFVTTTAIILSFNTTGYLRFTWIKMAVKTHTHTQREREREREREKLMRMSHSSEVMAGLLITGERRK